MRTELKGFIESILYDEGLGESEMPSIAGFLHDTDWFGMPPIKEDGKLYLDNDMRNVYRDKICKFLKRDTKEGKAELFILLHAKLPITAGQFQEFCDVAGVLETTAVYIADFLLYRLDKELFFLDDKEAELLVRNASNELTKAHGEQLTFFLSWLKSKYKTNYKNEYIMEKRYTVTYGKEAYDIDDYLQLLLYLYSEDYITEYDMYRKACDSKNFADTWLYLSMHFICSVFCKYFLEKVASKNGES